MKIRGGDDGEPREVHFIVRLCVRILCVKVWERESGDDLVIVLVWERCGDDLLVSGYWKYGE